jgi:hypothetical protein
MAVKRTRPRLPFRACLTHRERGNPIRAAGTSIRVSPESPGARVQRRRTALGYTPSCFRGRPVAGGPRLAHSTLGIQGEAGREVELEPPPTLTICSPTWRSRTSASAPPTARCRPFTATHTHARPVANAQPVSTLMPRGVTLGAAPPPPLIADLHAAAPVGRGVKADAAHDTARRTRPLSRTSQGCSGGRRELREPQSRRDRLLQPSGTSISSPRASRRELPAVPEFQQTRRRRNELQAAGRGRATGAGANGADYPAPKHTNAAPLAKAASPSPPSSSWASASAVAGAHPTARRR